MMEPGAGSREPGAGSREPGAGSAGLPETAPWTTVPIRYRVLGVVRTLTALDRLRDVFSCLADDARIEVRFTVVPGSPFATDLRTHLERADMRVVAWEDVTPDRFDLAISPSSNGDLHRLGIPLITLPHGAGHHKHRVTENGFTGEVSGLSRAQLVRGGRVVPRAIGLSHPDQLEVLRHGCPEAVERARVIGDPCYDRLRASIPMRERYRCELGVEDRKLVLVTSTWGRNSLFGRQPELASRLIDALPPDSYRVALVLHPNIWDQHSGYQVRLWIAHARLRGLLVVPPEQGWQAALVASDIVVGDHGSVTFYAACLGTPLLLAEFGTEEVVGGSPMAELGDRARRLAPDRLREAIDRAEPVAGHDALTSRAIAPVDRSAESLRELVCELLGTAPAPWTGGALPVESFQP